jgi:uncharacterized membrane protein
MTEYELSDAIGTTIGNMLSLAQFSFTLVTGYLVLAYFIGKNLTLFQVSFINLLFGLMYTALCMLSFGGVNHLASLVEQTNRGPSTLGAGAFLAVAISILAILGCYFFMWQVRHPKEE